MTFPARQGTPDTTYDHNDAHGLATVRTGADGVFEPADDREVALADAFGLPLAKVTKAPTTKPAPAGKED